jgi:hypothetical protein
MLHQQHRPKKFKQLSKNKFPFAISHLRCSQTLHGTRLASCGLLQALFMGHLNRGVSVQPWSWWMTSAAFTPTCHVIEHLTQMKARIPIRNKTIISKRLS